MPQFMVGSKNGFLPRVDPLAKLPPRFRALDELFQDMPVVKKDKSPGLLAQGNFGQAVDKTLPLISCSDINDSALLMALFRDFSFLASAYLLEPCDISFRKNGEFGLGREKLPKQIAVPLMQVSQKIGAFPFMEASGAAILS